MAVMISSPHHHPSSRQPLCNSNRGTLKSPAYKSFHKRDMLQNIPFFSALTPSELATLERLIKKKTYVKREVILSEEDSTHFMYVIFSGRVRVVLLSEDGREHIIAIHKRGDYFGEMALFDGKTSPATIIAIEESEIGLLAREDFEMFILQNSKVLELFITMLCLRLRESWMMIKIMSFSSAEQRVRAVLKNIGHLYGVRDKRGILVSLKLTHKDIAGYAAISRETVSRILSKFSKEGEIEFLENRQLLLKSSSLKNNHPL